MRQTRPFSETRNENEEEQLLGDRKKKTKQKERERERETEWLVVVVVVVSFDWNCLRGLCTNSCRMSFKPKRSSSVVHPLPGMCARVRERERDSLSSSSFFLCFYLSSFLFLRFLLSRSPSRVCAVTSPSTGRSGWLVVGAIVDCFRHR